MKKTVIILAVLALLFALGAWWWGGILFSPRVVQLAEGDTITNWDFQGSHNDDGALETRARDEIARLEGMVGSGSGESPDYQLYVGIAGQYSLLGDGKKVYEYLEKALAIDSTTTGLAWHNMAVLMERLGALATARDAYGRAVEAQPHIDAYHVARLQFLMKHVSEDFSVVDAAFSEAEVQFGPDAVFVHQLKAGWLAESGRLEEAIVEWEKMRSLVPAELQKDIEREIERLKLQNDKKLQG